MNAGWKAKLNRFNLEGRLIDATYHLTCMHLILMCDACPVRVIFLNLWMQRLLYIAYVSVSFISFLGLVIERRRVATDNN